MILRTRITVVAVLAFAVLVSLATSAQPQTADEWFDVLDRNHDGQIDKPEFSAGYDRLRIVDPPLKSSWWSYLPSLSLETGSDSTPKTPRQGSFWKAFSSAVAMIVATEIGDKTFFIAAVLSMKHDRAAVFLGAMGAVSLMTVISTAMGVVLPNIIPRRFTHFLSALLFLYFGVKLLAEARGMQAGKASEELEEVEEELLLQSNKKEDAVDEDDDTNDVEQPKSKSSRRRSKQHKALYQVALQSFTLTFLAEWGDRSQIATIALAASHDPVGTTAGGCVGHCLCTGLAVLGGRMLASRISERTVHITGGALFLFFGLHSLIATE